MAGVVERAPSAAAAPLENDEHRQPRHTSPLQVNTHHVLLFLFSRPLYVTQTTAVQIINPSQKTYTVSSITPNDPQFVITGHQKEVDIPPGKMYQTTVMFLPTRRGKTTSSISIELKGSSRAFSIGIEGIGGRNAYGIQSFVNVTVSMDSKYSSPVTIYNPKSFSIQVKKVFSSERFFYISLPKPDDHDFMAKDDVEEELFHMSLWTLAPKESRQVINLSFQPTDVGIFQGYIHILLSNEERLLVPVQVKVVRRALVSRPSRLKFGTLTFKSQTRARTLELHNLESQPVAVTSIIVEEITDPSVTISSTVMNSNMIIPAKSRRRATIALTFDGASDRASIEGSIRVVSNGTNFTVPFIATILHGTLAYSRKSVIFRTPLSHRPFGTNCSKMGTL